MPTYSSRNHLLTPRKGRRKLRSPCHSPSQVLLCTSLMPSPSASHAHSLAPGVWQHVWCARPLAATRAYPPHSSLNNVTPGRVMRSMNPCSVSASTVSATNRCASPVCRPTRPTTGGRSVAKVPCPRALLARGRGGSAGSWCGLPFFPRVLEHLVGFDLGIRQRRTRQTPPGVVLEFVSQRQQVAAAAAQFPGQAGGRGALSNATSDQHQLGGTALGALQGGAAEGVENATAGGTAVVQHGVAVGAMDGPVAAGAAGAAQALGVQGLDEVVVASLFVQQVKQREVHDRSLRGSARRSIPWRGLRKELTTNLGP